MTLVDSPLLIVDHRQDWKFTAALRGHFNVVEKQLACGDLVWSCPLGTVGVEDKCMADLMASLQNKRLDDELRRLVDTYAVPILFIRGTAPWGNRYANISQAALEKIKLGRQFHGVYIWQAPEKPDPAATSLAELYDYLSKPRAAGIEGVRRERKVAFGGPLGPRAEVIHGILGMTLGVRDRRGTALRIAETTPLSSFLSWSVSDFQFAGFTTRMAQKLTTVLTQLEEQSGTSGRNTSTPES